MNSPENVFRKLFLPYLVYIGLFIGTGFLSGSIVHFPMNPARFSMIGIIGAFIFTLSSTINEKYFNKANFEKEGVFKIIAFSLILSLGIGMISGAVQHFDEEPLYASYLIPSGLFISLLGYILKNDIRFSFKRFIVLGSVTVVVLAVLGFSLHSFAHEISSPHSHSEEVELHTN